MQLLSGWKEAKPSKNPAMMMNHVTMILVVKNDAIRTRLMERKNKERIT